MNLIDKIRNRGLELSLILGTVGILGLAQHSISRDNGRVMKVPKEIKHELFWQSPATVLVTTFPMRVVYDSNDDGIPDYTVVHHAPVRGVALKTYGEPTPSEIEWYINQTQK